MILTMSKAIAVQKRRTAARLPGFSKAVRRYCWRNKIPYAQLGVVPVPRDYREYDGE